MKVSLIIEIPVETECIENFTLRKSSDPYHPEDIAEIIQAFIKNELKKMHVKTSRFFYTMLTEIIENSYDAYASSGLKIGTHLIIETVVKIRAENVIVKIKDNGPGFNDKPKSILFSRNQIISTKKNPDKYIGGCNEGLANFEREVKSSNANIFFKNRKKLGASVHIFFPMKKDSLKFPSNNKNQTALSQLNEEMTHPNDCNPTEKCSKL